jgi:O-antigen/teichoic acid export membrane protein
MTAILEGAMNAKGVFNDGVYTLFGRILKTFFAVALSVLVSRALGPHDRGLYALPTVYTGLVLAVFAGISSAVSYFMLNAKVGRGILRPALLTGGIFTAVGAIPVIAMAELGHNAWACVPSLFLLPATVPAMIIFGYSLGTKRIRWNTTYQLLTTVALLVGIGIALWFFPHTAIVAVTAMVVVSVLVGAAILLVVLWDARVLPARTVPFGQFMMFSLRAGIVNLVSLLNYRADLYIVALLTTPSILGEYAVAVSAAEALLIVTQVPGIVTSPHVGSMVQEEAAMLTAKCVRGTFLLSLVVCAVCFAVAPYGVWLLYGSAYLPLVPALRVLLISVIFLSLNMPFSNYFTLKIGKPEIPLISNAVAALLCIVASWFLVQRFGMIGAATATAFAYLLGQAVSIAFFLRSANLRATNLSLAALLIPARSDLRDYTHMGRTFVRDVSRKIAMLRSEAA